MGISKSAVMDGSDLVGYAGPIDQTATRVGRRRWSLKQLLIAAGAPLLYRGDRGLRQLLLATGRFLVSTDDAYVQAHSVLISPKVSGYLSEVPVDDNRSVKAGQKCSHASIRAITRPRSTRRAPMSPLRRPQSTRSTNRSTSKGS